MATKFCYKCKTEKDVSEFNKNKSKASGLQEECKKCCGKYLREWRKKNKENIKIKARIYYQISEVKTRIKAHGERYRKDNKTIIQKRNKRYRNSPKAKLLNNKRRRERLASEPMFKLNCNISSKISESLQGGKNGEHWGTLVGYTLKQLKKHLERLFDDNMTWENYGEWHLEHKIPKSAFNFTKPEHRDFRKCWALKNLQPMWAKDNLAKGAKLEHHFQPSLLI